MLHLSRKIHIITIKKKREDKSQSQRKICQMQSTQKYYALTRYYITKLHSKNSH